MIRATCFSLLAFWFAPVCAQRLIPEVQNHILDKEDSSLGFGVAQDAVGRIYTGSYENSTVHIYDGASWQERMLPARPLDLISDSQGIVWVGLSDGIGRFVETPTGKLEFQRVPLDGVKDPGEFGIAHRRKTGVVAFCNKQVRVLVSHGRVQSVMQLPPGQEIVGMGSDCTYVVDRINDCLLSIIDNRQTLVVTKLDERKVIVAIEIENDKLLLWQSDKTEVFSNGTFKEFSNELNERTQQGKHVFFLLPMLDGIAVGYHGEFLFLNPDGTIRYRIGTSDGLPNELIVRVVPDQNGNLWLAHPSGLTCIFHSNPIWRLVDSNGGLKDCSSMRQLDGRRLFFTESKLVIGEASLERTKSAPLHHWMQFAKPVGMMNGRMWVSDMTGLFQITDQFQLRPVYRHDLMVAASLGRNQLVLGGNNGALTVVNPTDDEVVAKEICQFGSSIERLVAENEKTVWVALTSGELGCVGLGDTWDSPPKQTWKRLPGAVLSHLSGHEEVGNKPVVLHDNRFYWPSVDSGELTLEQCESLKNLNFEPYVWMDFGPDNTVFLIENRTAKQFRRVPAGIEETPIKTWTVPSKATASWFSPSSNELFVFTGDNVYLCRLDGSDKASVGEIVLQTSMLRTSGGKSEEVESAAEADELRFDFGVPQFGSFSRPEYRFRLNGLDADFSSWSHEATATYSRVPPGEYEFEVQARRNESPEIMVSARSALMRLPFPWYLTVWAIFLYTLLGVLLLTLVVKLRHRQLEQAKQKLAGIVEQQTVKLRSQTQQISRKNGQLHQEVLALRESESKRRDLEQRLNDKDRLESLGQLAGSVAHDFNNFLSVVVANTELLGDLSEDQEECRIQIFSATQRASELCRQMLLVSGGAQVEVQNHNLNDIVMGVSTLLKTTVEPVALNISICEHDMPPVEVDHSQVTQVVLNLASNAVEATRSGGGSQVQISTGTSFLSEEDLAKSHSIDSPPASGEYVWMEVSDDGPGIDETVRRRIFDPFFSTKSVGRGLGLATVLRVVSQHGGALFAESKIGSGTKIRVAFAASKNQSQLDDVGDASTDAAKTNGHRGLQMLLVDDDAHVRRSISRLLEWKGFKVVAFDNGKDALDCMATDTRFDAAIIDLSMPQMDGYQLIDGLRERRSNIPVVAISGYAENEGHDTLQNDRTKFIGKPFRSNELFMALQDLLRQ